MKNYDEYTDSELHRAYLKKFGDTIGTFETGLSYEEITEIYRECLKTGKPYEYDEEIKKLMEDPNVDF